MRRRLLSDAELEPDRRAISETLEMWRGDNSAHQRWLKQVACYALCELKFSLSHVAEIVELGSPGVARNRAVVAAQMAESPDCRQFVERAVARLRQRLFKPHDLAAIAAAGVEPPPIPQIVTPAPLPAATPRTSVLHVRRPSPVFSLPAPAAASPGAPSARPRAAIAAHARPRTRR
jgi:hypothetical protein